MRSVDDQGKAGFLMFAASDFENMTSTDDQDPPTLLDPRDWYVASVGTDRTEQEVSSKAVPEMVGCDGQRGNRDVEARPEGEMRRCEGSRSRTGLLYDEFPQRQRKERS